MIISNSLDKTLLRLCLNEYNLRTIVPILERLSEATELPVLYFLDRCCSARRVFTAMSMRYNMYSDIDTYTSHVISVFGIPFVYDFMKSIYESAPAGTLTLPLLFKIFHDSFTEYSEAVGQKQLEKDIPTLNADEIKFILIFTSALIGDEFSNIPRNFKHDFIN